ncbi:hypothetical protein [Zhenhengia yiwuensis]|uniref:Uncharacterized protein n=1 Tax=Zhenhengia yiwuensis TaxID=2763666 RepID=A0A926ENA8_9FIRM|nr:hypothetical protein [Zhenhengia yiwuensis]MBC8581580.1 hypothetical protein [Zhenhengia yiwuensis]
MKNTTNYGLKKPDGTDAVDIAIINQNMDTIDTRMKSNATQIDDLKNNKANTSHGNHVPATQSANNKKFLRCDNTWQDVTPGNIGAAAASHTHDDRYYTETEINTKLDAKANTSHTHTKSQITDFPTSLTANGGNADTVDGKHASDFASATGINNNLKLGQYVKFYDYDDGDSDTTMKQAYLRDGKWITGFTDITVMGSGTGFQQQINDLKSIVNKGGGDVAGKTYVKATKTVANTGNPNSNLEVINYTNSKGGVCKISQFGSAKMQIIVDGAMVLDGAGSNSYYSNHEFIQGNALSESYGELPTYPFKNNVKVVDRSSNAGTRVYTAHFYVNS